MCLGIHLNHEVDGIALVRPQACQHHEYFAPAGISREVVICEEVKADTVPLMVLANGTGQRLNRPETHFVPLHVNDRAETAVVWAKVFASDSYCGALPSYYVEYSCTHVCPDQPRAKS